MPNIDDIGVWGHEMEFQAHISSLCTSLPSSSEVATQYNKDRAKNPSGFDSSPYKLNPLGLTAQPNLAAHQSHPPCGGDFTSVSQFAWDEIRFKQLESERPQHDAYKRAVAMGGAGLDESEKEKNEKISELKAKALDMDMDGAFALSSELKAKKKRAPEIYTPFQWDPNNPAIPWPETPALPRALGPAHDRLEGKKCKVRRTMDPFTGTWVIEKLDTGKSGEALIYEADKNAYVGGDVLAGLRNKRRHDRIVDARSFLDWENLDEGEKEKVNKADKEKKQAAEALKAKRAVLERKLRSQQMQKKLAEIGQKGVNSKFRRPRTAPVVASNVKYSGNSGNNGNDNDSDNDNGEDDSSSNPDPSKHDTPKRRNKSIRISSTTLTVSLKPSSAGSTPWTSFFGGIRDMISRGSSRGAKFDQDVDADADADADTDHVVFSDDNKTDDEGGEDPPRQKKKKKKRRRKKKKLLPDDATEYTDATEFTDATSKATLQSGMFSDSDDSFTTYTTTATGATGTTGATNATNFEFLDDVSVPGEHSLSSKKKRKNSRKKSRGKISVTSMFSSDEDIDIDDESTIATSASNMQSVTSNSFEFIDDLSLASSMGTQTIDSSPAEKGEGSKKKRRNSVTIVEEGDEIEIEDQAEEEMRREIAILTQQSNKLLNIDPDAEAKLEEENDITKLAPPASKLRKALNKISKQTARFERFLIRKHLWKKSWQVHNRTKVASSGFTKADRDPRLVLIKIRNRAISHSLLLSNKIAKRLGYMSYFLVLVLAGEDGAQSMGLKEFLMKRSLSGEEMITAASDGERPIVLRALTQIKGRVKADARNYAGFTALMSAIESSTKLLTNDELRDWDRSQRKQQKIEFLRRPNTPENVEVIRKAREKKYTRVLELLLAKGADINAHCIGTMDEDVSALHIACYGGSVDRVKWLLANGADINCSTENGMTPLHFASKCGRNEIVMYLLTQDANPVARNDMGWTSLHYAARSGGTRCVKILLKAGIDKTIKDVNGHNAAVIAKNYGNKMSFNYLRKFHTNTSAAKEYLVYLEKKMVE